MNPVDLLKTMQTMLTFQADDVSRLKELGPLLIPHSEEMSRVFYAALDSIPESKAILDADLERRERLHMTLIEWYSEIFSGVYDEAYAQRRWIIGLVHVKVDIPPKFVVASIENVYLFSVQQVAKAAGQLRGPLEEYVTSLSKMLNTDLAFIEQSYSQSTSRAMANEIGANEALFKRFAANGAKELLEEARHGHF